MEIHQPRILTKVGTNELEIVEFFVEDQSYAINVAKVREIIQFQSPRPVPQSHPCLVGLFQNRDDVIPLIDLGKWLGSKTNPEPRQAKVILCEFNKLKVGFVVHGVSRIHRVSWTDLETLNSESMVESQAILGFLRLGKANGGERIVSLIDFERIVAEIKGDKEEPILEDPAASRRSGKVVLVAEDSPLIRKILRRRLEVGGFTVVEAQTGEEAWRLLDEGVHADALVSDIEMPRMDGHHLTRLVKNDPRFHSLPVALYSSMIYEEMRHKGDAVGADAQICKPELESVVNTMDKLIFGEAV